MIQKSRKSRLSLRPNRRVFRRVCCDDVITLFFLSPQKREEIRAAYAQVATSNLETNQVVALSQNFGYNADEVAAIPEANMGVRFKFFFFLFFSFVVQNSFVVQTHGQKLM